MSTPDTSTEEETRSATVRYVKTVSGFQTPSRDNEAAFETAVQEITAATDRLVNALHAKASPRDREIEAAKARARFAEMGA